MNKLCLGTVQFGLNYGVNNFFGKPTQEKTFKILDLAVNKGIKMFDTAYAYGNAEELLGLYDIKNYSAKVISKLRPNLITPETSHTEQVVIEQIEGSLQRMNLESLDGYLLHTPLNFYNSKIIKGLQQAKREGLINHFGVSIYETEHALDVVKSGIVDYIQVPYSIFDQRLDQTEFFKIAKQNGITVFARSAFLQGLLLMDRLTIPEHLQRAISYLDQFDYIIEKYNFTRVQAALLFAYTHPDIDYVVFGVDNEAQLLEDITISEQYQGFEACRDEISKGFKNISKAIIFPSLWSHP